MSVIDSDDWREFFQEFMDLPVLWKIKSNIYKNRDLKNKAYLRLLKTYKKIESDATSTLKTKITNLRTCYRRELKKVKQSEKSGAGVDDIYIPSLWYFDLLDFLKDHETSIPGISSLDSEDGGEEIENEDQFEQEVQKKKRICPNKKDVNIRKEVFLQKAVDHLEQINNRKPYADEESDIFARAWAISFKKLTEEQKIYAKKAIDEILLLGQLNQLSLNVIPPISPLCNISFNSQSSTPLNSPSPKFSIISNQVLASNENISYEPRNTNQPSYSSLQDLFSDNQYS